MNSLSTLLLPSFLLYLLKQTPGYSTTTLGARTRKGGTRTWTQTIEEEDSLQVVQFKWAICNRLGQL